MIPSKVKVGGIIYSVKEVDYVQINGNRNYQGSCNYNASEITLLNTLSDDRKEQTFVHELLHAIMDEAGFEEQDEDLVNRASIVLYQVLKDNQFTFGD